MKKFLDWLTEMEMGFDPLVSAITKISKGRSKEPLTTHKNLSELKSQFELDEEEVEKLKDSEIIVNKDGWSIDEDKFEDILKQMPTTVSVDES